MLCDILASRFQLSSAEERLDQYRISAEGNCSKTIAKEVVRDALDFWRGKISARDRISLTFACDGESKGVTDLSEASSNLLNEIFELADDDCQLSLELIVNKVVQNQRLSVYAPHLLAEYFTNTPIVRVLESLAGRLNGGLVFECMTPISAASSAGISFEFISDTSKVVCASGKVNRGSILGVFRENSFSRSLPQNLVPQDFHLASDTGVPGIDNFFRRACTLVSAIYLSSSAEVGGDGNLEYRIAGYKNVAGVVPLEELESSSEILFKIVDWAYGDGGSSDKVGLARNVVSLHVDNLKEVVNHSEILHAINSNYQIYLRDNVESYLEVKGKITDVLVDAVKKTHDIVDSFLDSFKNGIFVLLTFVLTVVVVNGLKDTNAAAIFSEAYIWVVGVLSVLMTAWVVSARAGSLMQFDKAFDSIEQVLKVNYRGVLEVAEIESALSPVRSSNREYLRERSRHYVLLWLFIVVALVIGFVAGNRYFAIVPLVSDSSNVKVVDPFSGVKDVDAGRPSSPDTIKVDPKPSLAPGNPLDRRVDLRKKNIEQLCCR